MEWKTDKYSARYALTTVGLAAVLLASGCSDAATTNQSAQAQTEVSAAQGATPATEQAATSAEAAYPRTVEHLAGSTTIAENPVRVATPYIGFVDYMAVLDEYPIAAQSVETIRSNFPSLSKRLVGKDIEDLGNEVNLEAILQAKPDLIIAADDMQGDYDRLSAIAPTVILPQAGEWKDTLKQIASILGDEEKADRILSDFAAKSADYKEKLAVHHGESVLFAMYSGKDTFITWETSRFEPFYTGLGLTVPQGAEKGGQLTLEGVAEIDPDHLFVINNWQQPIAGGVQEALKDSAVWNSLTAVKNNQVYYLEDPSLPGPMALAKIDGIEEIMKAMGSDE